MRQHNLHLWTAGRCLGTTAESCVDRRRSSTYCQTAPRYNIKSLSHPTRDQRLLFRIQPHLATTGGPPLLLQLSFSIILRDIEEEGGGGPTTTPCSRPLIIPVPRLLCSLPTHEQRGTSLPQNPSDDHHRSEMTGDPSPAALQRLKEQLKSVDRALGSLQPHGPSSKTITSAALAKAIREAGEGLRGLVRTLEDVRRCPPDGDGGGCAVQYQLGGSHVPSKLIGHVVERVVTPALAAFSGATAGAGSRSRVEEKLPADIRQEIIVPFIALFDAVHHGLPLEPRSEQGQVVGASAEPCSWSWWLPHAGPTGGGERERAALHRWLQPTTAAAPPGYYAGVVTAAWDSGAGSLLLSTSVCAEADLSVAPLLYREGAALYRLLDHIRRVCESETLFPLVGQAYLQLLGRVTAFDSYRRCIGGRQWVLPMVHRVMQLLERVGAGAAEESTKRARADNGAANLTALASIAEEEGVELTRTIDVLTALPQFALCLSAGTSERRPLQEQEQLLHSFAALVLRRHQSQLRRDAHNLRFEAACLRSLRLLALRLLGAAGTAPPLLQRVGVAGVLQQLATCLCDAALHPMTLRAEAWRTELCGWWALYVAGSLSRGIASAVADDTRCASSPAPALIRPSPASPPAADAAWAAPVLRTLFEAIWPMVARLLWLPVLASDGDGAGASGRRVHYTFASYLELYRFPWPPSLQLLMDAGAVVLYAGAAGMVHYLSQINPTDEEAARRQLAALRLPRRRSSSTASDPLRVAAPHAHIMFHLLREVYGPDAVRVEPIEGGVASVQLEAVHGVHPGAVPRPPQSWGNAGPSTSSAAAAAAAPALCWLHLLAQPGAMLHTSAAECDGLVAALAPLWEQAPAAGPLCRLRPLLGAVFTAAARRCSPAGRGLLTRCGAASVSGRPEELALRLSLVHTLCAQALCGGEGDPPPPGMEARGPEDDISAYVGLLSDGTAPPPGRDAEPRAAGEQSRLASLSAPLLLSLTRWLGRSWLLRVSRRGAAAAGVAGCAEAADVGLLFCAVCTAYAPPTADQQEFVEPTPVADREPAEALGAEGRPASAQDAAAAAAAFRDAVDRVEADEFVERLNAAETFLLAAASRLILEHRRSLPMADAAGSEDIGPTAAQAGAAQHLMDHLLRQARAQSLAQLTSLTPLPRSLGEEPVAPIYLLPSLAVASCAPHWVPPPATSAADAAEEAERDRLCRQLLAHGGPATPLRLRGAALRGAARSFSLVRKQLQKGGRQWHVPAVRLTHWLMRQYRAGVWADPGPDSAALRDVVEQFPPPSRPDDASLLHLSWMDQVAASLCHAADVDGPQCNAGFRLLCGFLCRLLADSVEAEAVRHALALAPTRPLLLALQRLYTDTGEELRRLERGAGTAAGLPEAVALRASLRRFLLEASVIRVAPQALSRLPPSRAASELLALRAAWELLAALVDQPAEGDSAEIAMILREVGAMLARHHLVAPLPAETAGATSTLEAVEAAGGAEPRSPLDAVAASLFPLLQRLALCCGDDAEHASHPQWLWTRLWVALAQRSGGCTPPLSGGERTDLASPFFVASTAFERLLAAAQAAAPAGAAPVQAVAARYLLPLFPLPGSGSALRRRLLPSAHAALLEAVAALCPAEPLRVLGALASSLHPCAALPTRIVAGRCAAAVLRPLAAGAGCAEAARAALLEAARDGLLGDAGAAKTSLLALAEALAAAPPGTGTGAALIYAVLECWSSRSFSARREVLDWLSWVASRWSVGEAGCSDRASPAAVPGAVVALCRSMLRPALFRWLWLSRHPVEAFPYALFGYGSQRHFLLDNVPLALLVGLLLGGRGAASVAAFSPAAIFDRAAGVYYDSPWMAKATAPPYAAAVRPESGGWRWGASDLAPLVAHLPAVSGALLVAAQLSVDAVASSSPCGGGVHFLGGFQWEAAALREMSAAAHMALRWLDYAVRQLLAAPGSRSLAALLADRLGAVLLAVADVCLPACRPAEVWTPPPSGSDDLMSRAMIACCRAVAPFHLSRTTAPSTSMLTPAGPPPFAIPQDASQPAECADILYAASLPDASCAAGAGPLERCYALLHHVLAATRAALRPVGGAAAAAPVPISTLRRHGGAAPEMEASAAARLALLHVRRWCGLCAEVLLPGWAAAGGAARRLMAVVVVRGTLEVLHSVFELRGRNPLASASSAAGPPPIDAAGTQRLCDVLLQWVPLVVEHQRPADAPGGASATLRAAATLLCPESSGVDRSRLGPGVIDALSRTWEALAALHCLHPSHCWALVAQCRPSDHAAAEEVEEEEEADGGLPFLPVHPTAHVPPQAWRRLPGDLLLLQRLAEAAVVSLAPHSNWAPHAPFLPASVPDLLEQAAAQLRAARGRLVQAARVAMACSALGPDLCGGIRQLGLRAWCMANYTSPCSFLGGAARDMAKRHGCEEPPPPTVAKEASRTLLALFRVSLGYDVVEVGRVALLQLTRWCRVADVSGRLGVAVLDAYREVSWLFIDLGLTKEVHAWVQASLGAGGGPPAAALRRCRWVLPPAGSAAADAEFLYLPEASPDSRRPSKENTRLLPQGMEAEDIAAQQEAEDDEGGDSEAGPLQRLLDGRPWFSAAALRPLLPASALLPAARTPAGGGPLQLLAGALTALALRGPYCIHSSHQAASPAPEPIRVLRLPLPDEPKAREMERVTQQRWHGVLSRFRGCCSDTRLLEAEAGPVDAALVRGYDGLLQHWAALSAAPATSQSLLALRALSLCGEAVSGTEVHICGADHLVESVGASERAEAEAEALGGLAKAPARLAAAADEATERALLLLVSCAPIGTSSISPIVSGSGAAADTVRAGGEASPCALGPRLRGLDPPATTVTTVADADAATSPPLHFSPTVPFFPCVALSLEPAAVPGARKRDRQAAEGSARPAPAGQTLVMRPVLMPAGAVAASSRREGAGWDGCSALAAAARKDPLLAAVLSEPRWTSAAAAVLEAATPAALPAEIQQASLLHRTAALFDALRLEEGSPLWSLLAQRPPGVPLEPLERCFLPLFVMAAGRSYGLERRFVMFRAAAPLVRMEAIQLLLHLADSSPGAAPCRGGGPPGSPGLLAALPETISLLVAEVLAYRSERPDKCSDDVSWEALGVGGAAAASGPSCPTTLLLFPVVWALLLLSREEEEEEEEAAWGSRLWSCVCPTTAGCGVPRRLQRQFLERIEWGHRVLYGAVRTCGVAALGRQDREGEGHTPSHTSPPPPPRPYRASMLLSPLFASVAPLADPADLLWPRGIGAGRLARAALALAAACDGAPAAWGAAAAFWMEWSGESHCGPHTGLPTRPLLALEGVEAPGKSGATSVLFPCATPAPRADERSATTSTRAQLREQRHRDLAERRERQMVEYAAAVFPVAALLPLLLPDDECGLFLPLSAGHLHRRSVCRDVAGEAAREWALTGSVNPTYAVLLRRLAGVELEAAQTAAPEPLSATRFGALNAAGTVFSIGPTDEEDPEDVAALTAAAVGVSSSASWCGSASATPLSDRLPPAAALEGAGREVLERGGREPNELLAELRARLLLHAGLPTLAADTLLSAVQQGGASQRRLRSLLAEAACRCGEWDTDTPLLAASAESGRWAACRAALGSAGGCPSLPRGTDGGFEVLYRVLGHLGDAEAVCAACEGLRGIALQHIAEGGCSGWVEGAHLLQAAADLREAGQLAQVPAREARVPSWLRSAAGLRSAVNGGVATTAHHVGLLPLQPASALLAEARQGLCAQLMDAVRRRSTEAAADLWCLWAALVQRYGAVALDHGLAAAAQLWVSRLAAGRSALVAPKGQEGAGSERDDEAFNSISPVRVTDGLRTALVLLQARCLHSSGCGQQAARMLQSGPFIASNGGNGLMSAAMLASSLPGGYQSPGLGLELSVVPLPAPPQRCPRIVQQLMAWELQAGRLPLTTLVRDRTFSESACADSAVSLQLAQLCHRLAKAIASRLHSPEFVALEETLRQSRATRESLVAGRQDLHDQLATIEREGPSGDATEARRRRLRDNLKSLEHRLRSLEADIAREENMLRAEVQSYDLYRRSAINSYGRYLTLGTAAAMRCSAGHLYSKGAERCENTVGEETGCPCVDSDGPGRRGSSLEGELSAVYGLVELWLRGEDEKMDEINPRTNNAHVGLLAEIIGKVPTYPFLHLYALLAAQLGDHTAAPTEKTRRKPTDALEDVLTRVAAAHPDACIWTLLSLAHGDQYDAKPRRPTDGATTGAVKAERAALFFENCVVDGPGSDGMHVFSRNKIMAARTILQNLFRESNGSLKQLLREMSWLSEAYIELAFFQKYKDSDTRKVPIPPHMDFVQLCRDSRLSVAPPTYSPSTWTGARGRYCGARLPFATRQAIIESLQRPICETGHGASYLPRLQQYAAYFTTPGGITRPKVLRCCMSDGQRMKQLLKSNDDLRQDATLQRFFQLTNTLLALSPPMGVSVHASNGKSAALSLRTYHVVPLAPTVGVVEWVDHTVPLGEYVTGSDSQGGAHQRYFPEEISARVCRQRLQGSRHKTQELASLYDAFTPSLHYFFYEHFTSSCSLWLSRQQQFGRSVAMGSMVGYLVGLGDRHGSNLLLHRQTGEVVHIDLGFAFDQAKLLPIPERVPFRMTRNIVDGLGVRGVRGSFSVACASVLRVLRAARPLLLLVLESLLHDPLARWSIAADLSSPARPEPALGAGYSGHGTAASRHQQALGPQQRRGALSRSDAQRAISRVEEKLCGYDNNTKEERGGAGGGEHFGPVAHVHKLLEEAQFLENLAHMFPGWSPWL
eukprot:gene6254-4503_t